MWRIYYMLYSAAPRLLHVSTATNQHATVKKVALSACPALLGAARRKHHVPCFEVSVAQQFLRLVNMSYYQQEYKFVLRDGKPFR
jgi:hypothetical protein